MKKLVENIKRILIQESFEFQILKAKIVMYLKVIIVKYILVALIWFGLRQVIDAGLILDVPFYLYFGYKFRRMCSFVYFAVIRLFFRKKYKNLKFSKLSVNKKNRSHHIVVSLTSYGSRVEKLELTLKSLCYQKTQADIIVLWLDEGEFSKDSLPEELAKFKELVEIKFCPNYKSYKKIIPALAEFENSLIITADDDIIYPHFWINGLYNEFLQNKNNVIPCYKIWRNKPALSLVNYDVIGSGCGVLFPPQSLDKKQLDYDFIKKIGLVTHDDLFISYIIGQCNWQFKEVQAPSFNLRKFLLPWGEVSGLHKENSRKKTREYSLILNNLKSSNRSFTKDLEHKASQ